MLWIIQRGIKRNRTYSVTTAATIARTSIHNCCYYTLQLPSLVCQRAIISSSSKQQQAASSNQKAAPSIRSAISDTVWLQLAFALAAGAPSKFFTMATVSAGPEGHTGQQ